jgi:hypothetical protein
MGFHYKKAPWRFWGCADCSVGGILQLLLELQYLSQVLRPMLRPPCDQMVDEAVATILEKIDMLAEEGESGEVHPSAFSEVSSNRKLVRSTLPSGSVKGREQT